MSYFFKNLSAFCTTLTTGEKIAVEKIIVKLFREFCDAT